MDLENILSTQNQSNPVNGPNGHLNLIEGGNQSHLIENTGEIISMDYELGWSLYVRFELRGKP